MSKDIYLKDMVKIFLSKINIIYLYLYQKITKNFYKKKKIEEPYLFHVKLIFPFFLLRANPLPCVCVFLAWAPPLTWPNHHHQTPSSFSFSLSSSSSFSARHWRCCFCHCACVYCCLRFRWLSATNPTTWRSETTAGFFSSLPGRLRRLLSRRKSPL